MLPFILAGIGVLLLASLLIGLLIFAFFPWQITIIIVAFCTLTGFYLYTKTRTPKSGKRK